MSEFPALENRLDGLTKSTVSFFRTVFMTIDHLYYIHFHTWIVTHVTHSSANCNPSFVFPTWYSHSSHYSSIYIKLARIKNKEAVAFGNSKSLKVNHVQILFYKNSKRNCPHTPILICENRLLSKWSLRCLSKSFIYHIKVFFLKILITYVIIYIPHPLSTA